MKEVHVDEIISTVEKLFIDANYDSSQNVVDTLEKAIDKEESPVGKEVLRELIKNANLARDERIPICQDTGLAVTFIEVGQDVHITGGSLVDAVNEGVRRGYAKGYLRKSACHPFTRKNTGDNTPAILHTKIVPGDKVKITVLPKGGGSENYGIRKNACTFRGKRRYEGIGPGNGNEGRTKSVSANHCRGWDRG